MDFISTVKAVTVTMSVKVKGRDSGIQLNWINGRIKIIDNPQFQFVCRTWEEALAKSTTIITLNEDYIVDVKLTTI